MYFTAVVPIKHDGCIVQLYKKYFDSVVKTGKSSLAAPEVVNVYTPFVPK
jgi:hypothetical protein